MSVLCITGQYPNSRMIPMHFGLFGVDGPDKAIFRINAQNGGVTHGDENFVAVSGKGYMIAEITGD